MELFIILYLISVILFFIFEVGYTHGHDVKEYTLLMSKGLYEHRINWPLHVFVALMWPTAVPAVFLFSRGGGWVWPKKGVTYLKEKN